MAEPRPAEVQSRPGPATNENQNPLVEASQKADDPAGPTPRVTPPTRRATRPGRTPGPARVPAGPGPRRR